MASMTRFISLIVEKNHMNHRVNLSLNSLKVWFFYEIVCIKWNILTLFYVA